jgi:hypothetical protein
MTDVQDRNKTDEAWVKHLEFIQNAITRMATNSFWLKGWAVTLVAATFALNITTPSSLLKLAGFDLRGITPLRSQVRRLATEHYFCYNIG